MKTCTKCRQEKALDAFNRDASRADGLTSQCKACRATKAKASRDADPKYNAKAAKYRRDRRVVKGDQMRATERAYRAANGDKVRAKERAYMAGYRAANGDRLRQYHRDRYAADSGPKLEAKARRKAARLNAAMGGPVNYKQLRADFPDCYLCGLPLDGRIQYDHVIPLVPREGEPAGAHCTGNLRPTHRRCNLRKSNARLTDLGWYHGPTNIGVAVN